MSPSWSFVPSIALLFALTSVAGSATLSEDVDGDLSDDPAAPTRWTLEVGANTLLGTAGLGGAVDYDVLTITVPSGLRLDSLVLSEYQNTSAAFIGMQAGDVWTANLGFFVDGNALIGWQLFDGSHLGTDLLPDMGDNNFNPSVAVSAPAPSGDYVILLQDTGTPFSYGFTFHVSEVPEPRTLATVAIAGLAIASPGKRRRC